MKRTPVFSSPLTRSRITPDALRITDQGEPVPEPRAGSGFMGRVFGARGSKRDADREAALEDFYTTTAVTRPSSPADVNNLWMWRRGRRDRPSGPSTTSFHDYLLALPLPQDKVDHTFSTRLTPSPHIFPIQ